MYLTHSAKLWKTLVTRSFSNTIRTPWDRMYLEAKASIIVGYNRLYYTREKSHVPRGGSINYCWFYIREKLTPLLCLSQFCARLSEWYLWRSLVLGTRSENQKMDLMETIYEEGKELISAPHWYWYWSLLPADIAHFFGTTLNGKYEDFCHALHKRFFVLSWFLMIICHLSI